MRRPARTVSESVSVPVPCRCRCRSLWRSCGRGYPLRAVVRSRVRVALRATRPFASPVAEWPGPSQSVYVRREGGSVRLAAQGACASRCAAGPCVSLRGVGASGCAWPAQDRQGEQHAARSERQALGRREATREEQMTVRQPPGPPGPTHPDPVPPTPGPGPGPPGPTPGPAPGPVPAPGPDPVPPPVPAARAGSGPAEPGATDARTGARSRARSAPRAGHRTAGRTVAPSGLTGTDPASEVPYGCRTPAVPSGRTAA